MTDSIKRLYRSRSNRKIAGVCGGLGEYFNVDPTIVRLLFVLVVLFSVGFGVIVYILMWIIVVPEKEKTTRNLGVKKRV